MLVPVREMPRHHALRDVIRVRGRDDRVCVRPRRSPEAYHGVDAVLGEMAITAPRPFDCLERGFERAGREPTRGVQRPGDVSPRRDPVVEHILRGDAMVPHWAHPGEQGQGREATVAGELDETEVREVARTSWYDVIIGAQHREFIGAVGERILSTAADV